MSHSIDPNDVKKVASLAKLVLTEEDSKNYSNSLSKVLDYFSLVNDFVSELDSSWRPDVLESPTPERGDVVQSLGLWETAIKDAPESQGSAFVVPRIFE